MNKIIVEGTLEPRATFCHNSSRVAYLWGRWAITPAVGQTSKVASPRPLASLDGQRIVQRGRSICQSVHNSRLLSGTGCERGVATAQRGRGRFVPMLTPLIDSRKDSWKGRQRFQWTPRWEIDRKGFFFFISQGEEREVGLAVTAFYRKGR